MLSTIVLARSLETPAFAAFSYFHLTVSMLAAYAAMGLGVTASRFFAEVGYEKAEAAPPPLGTLCVLSILISVIAAVVILFLPDQWLSGGLAIPRWLLSAGALTLALGVIPGGAILGLERYREAAIVSAISGGLLIAGALLAASHHSPKLAMLAIVFAALFQAGGQYAIAIRVTGWQRIRDGLWLRKEAVTKVFGFAGPMLLVSLMSASGSWLVGRIILGGEGGENAFALYIIGLQWFSLTLLLPGMISRVLLPSVVRSAVTNAEIGRRLTKQGALLATSLAFVMALGGALFGPWLLSLYGDQYEAGRWFIAAFMGAALMSAPANTLGNAIVARDRQMIWLLITATWFVTLILAAQLFKGSGPWAGAIAQALGAGVLVSIAVVVARVKKMV
jgi:O-antigen/teichoic acid export membrane protein